MKRLFLSSAAVVALVTGLSAAEPPGRFSGANVDFSTVPNDTIPSRSVLGGQFVATASAFPGIDPTGATSSVAGLRAIIPAVNAAGGGDIFIPAGTYKIDATIDNSSSTFALASNIRIRFSPGAKFVATSALSASMWKIWGATDATYNLEIQSPQMDASAGSCDLTCQGGEGLTTLELQSLKTAIVYNPQMYGGTTYNGSIAAGQHSNNGITTTKVVTAQVYGGSICGFPNAGIYTVGDLVAGIGSNKYSTAVFGTYFCHNNVAVQGKFSLDSLLVSGATLDYNHVGFGTYNAGAANVEPAARRATFTGNTISHTQAEGIHCDGQTKLIATGNVFLDLGYNEANTLTNSGTQFVNANGCSNFNVSANTFGIKDWTNSSFVGMLVTNATLDASYTGGNGRFDNVVNGLTYIWYEGASVNASDVSASVNNGAGYNLTNANTTVRFTPLNGNLYTIGKMVLTGSITGAGSILNAVDLRSMTISGFAFASPGFSVDGSGGTTMFSAALSAIAISSLPTCNSAKAGTVVFINNGVAAPTYHQTVSATGAATWPVSCTYNGTTYNWAY